MAMTSTVLQALRADYSNVLDKYETRGSTYGLTQLGKANATDPRGIISGDVLAKAQNSWGRDLQIPVMSTASAANGTGVSCSFTATESISDLVGVTWVSLSNGFKMQPAKNFQNEIDYFQEFARKYTDAIRKIADAIDASIDTVLTANITPGADYNSTFVGGGNDYPFTANVMGVSLAKRSDFFNELPDIMAADELFPMFDIVGNTNMRSIVNKLYAQGASNDENTQYQFTKGDFDFMFSNKVTNTPATSSASAFAMPKGSYAIINRNSPDCMAGVSTTKGVDFGLLQDATLGMTMDNIYSSDCGSIAALSGNALDTTAVIESHQMGVHYGVVFPYTSLKSGVIRKFDFLKA